MGFYENLIELCYKRKEPITVVLSNCGVNRSACTRWKNGEMPNSSSMLKLCDYLKVTPEELKGDIPDLRQASIVLSDEEAQLLALWRIATDEEKEGVAFALRKRGFTFAPKSNVKAI